MTVSSTGGSGLDVQTIVSGIMQAERIPLSKLNSTGSDIDVKLSALGKLRSALSDLENAAEDMKSASKLGGFTATSSDEDVLEVTSSGGSREESHDVKVIQLATTHRLASDSFENLTDTIPAGTYTFGTGEDSFDIELAEGENSLQDLGDAINSATDNSIAFASTLKTDDGYKLILSAREGGTDNALTVLPAQLNLAEISEANNAEVEIDGVLIHPSSNNLTDVIPGLSLTLNQLGESRITTKVDSESVEETMNAFVDAYNSVSTLMDRYNSNELKGEGLSNSIENQLRNSFFGNFEDAEGATHNVFEFGLTFDKGGTLSINSSKLKNAMEDDFSGFISFFTNNDSFSDRLEDSVSSLLATNGLMDSRKDSYDNERDRVDARIGQLEYRLEKKEERYFQQYSKLDALLIQMNSTSSNIASQLSSLTGDS